MKPVEKKNNNNKGRKRTHIVYSYGVIHKGQKNDVFYGLHSTDAKNSSNKNNSNKRDEKKKYKKTK